MTDLSAKAPLAPHAQADARQRAIALKVAGGFLAFALVRILLHVAWRDEVRAWQLVLGVDSLPGLRAATKFDGHPPLWSLLLYMLSKVTANFRAVQLLHAVIASGGVWIVARFAPSRPREILLVCVGYFVFFEYTIVARDYALGVLFFFGALACFHRMGDRRWGFAACCAGAVLSNPMVAFLAAALGLTAFADDVLHWRTERRRPALAELAWLLLPIASAAVALWAMLPGPDTRYAPPPSEGISWPSVAAALCSVWQAFVPIPTMDRLWWNTCLFAPEPATTPSSAPIITLLGLISLAIMFAIAWSVRRQRLALLFLLLSWSFLLAFAVTRFPGTLRHQGHYVLAVLGAWWLAPGTREPPGATITPRRPPLMIYALLVTQALGGLVASYRDLSQPFSAAPAVAAWIREKAPGLRLIGNADYAAVPVAAQLGVPFFALDSYGFVTWNTQGPSTIDRFAAHDAAHRLAEILRSVGDRRMLLVRNALLDPSQRQTVATDVTRAGGPAEQLLLTPLASFPDSAVKSEQYTVILVELRPGS